MHTFIRAAVLALLPVAAACAAPADSEDAAGVGSSGAAISTTASGAYWLHHASGLCLATSASSFDESMPALAVACDATTTDQRITIFRPLGASGYQLRAGDDRCLGIAGGGWASAGVAIRAAACGTAPSQLFQIVPSSTSADRFDLTPLADASLAITTASATPSSGDALVLEPRGSAAAWTGAPVLGTASGRTSPLGSGSYTLMLGYDGRCMRYQPNVVATLAACDGSSDRVARLDGDTERGYQISFSDAARTTRMCLDYNDAYAHYRPTLMPAPCSDASPTQRFLYQAGMLVPRAHTDLELTSKIESGVPASSEYLLVLAPRGGHTWVATAVDGGIAVRAPETWVTPSSASLDPRGAVAFLDSSSHETGYDVFVRPLGGAWSDVLHFAPLAPNGSASQWLPSAYLAPGATYEVKVRVEGASGFSDGATQILDARLPPAPANVSAHVAIGGVSITWNGPTAPAVHEYALVTIDGNDVATTTLIDPTWTGDPLAAHATTGHLDGRTCFEILARNAWGASQAVSAGCFGSGRPPGGGGHYVP